MKVTIEIYKVEATGLVSVEAATVKDAKNKVLTMAKAHSLTMSPPEEEFIAIVKKAVD